MARRAAAAATWTTGCLAKLVGTEEYAEVMETVPKTMNPRRLVEFGYHYDDMGRLVQIKTGKPFAWLGQKHYDRLGDAIVEELYAILREKYGFSQVRFPQSNLAANKGTCPIFVSANFDSAPIVVLLIQGSGAVRPGMWARALCINNSLNEGAIFLYVEEILRRGWGVVVLNPNENEEIPPADAAEEPDAVGAEKEKIEEFWLGTPDKVWKAMQQKQRARQVRIEGSECPEVHALGVWDEYIAPRPRPTLIIAHSYGGKCTTALLRHRKELFCSTVLAVAWTDAINDIVPRKERDPRCVEFIQKVSVNWVGSKKPLDSPEHPTVAKCVELSAGHEVHEWTSSSCRTSVFRFLDERVQALRADHTSS